MKWCWARNVRVRAALGLMSDRRIEKRRFRSAPQIITSVCGKIWFEGTKSSKVCHFLPLVLNVHVSISALILIVILLMEKHKMWVTEKSQIFAWSPRWNFQISWKFLSFGTCICFVWTACEYLGRLQLQTQTNLSIINSVIYKMFKSCEKQMLWFHKSHFKKKSIKLPDEHNSQIRNCFMFEFFLHFYVKYVHFVAAVKGYSGQVTTTPHASWYSLVSILLLLAVS